MSPEYQRQLARRTFCEALDLVALDAEPTSHRSEDMYRHGLPDAACQLVSMSEGGIRPGVESG
jgi:hypothetical protein